MKVSTRCLSAVMVACDDQLVLSSSNQLLYIIYESEFRAPRESGFS